MIAMITVPASGTPASRPRSASIIGVKGWHSANNRRPTGMDLLHRLCLDTPKRGRPSTAGFGRRSAENITAE
jgi:hypothetical protein